MIQQKTSLNPHSLMAKPTDVIFKIRPETITSQSPRQHDFTTSQAMDFTIYIKMQNAETHKCSQNCIKGTEGRNRGKSKGGFVKKAENMITMKKSSFSTVKVKTKKVFFLPKVQREKERTSNQFLALFSSNSNWHCSPTKSQTLFVWAQR